MERKVKVFFPLLNLQKDVEIKTPPKNQLKSNENQNHCEKTVEL